MHPLICNSVYDYMSQLGIKIMKLYLYLKLGRATWCFHTFVVTFSLWTHPRSPQCMIKRITCQSNNTIVQGSAYFLCVTGAKDIKMDGD